MIKTRPTAVQLAAIAGFVLSCFGLALFLWVTFGGPSPLLAERYEVKVPFDEATQLADQADVRISGVSVGKVSDIDLPPGGGRAVATLAIESKFAPLPQDTRATLRAKTLLGETYVEITPGGKDTPTIPEGGSLPEAQVAETVQIDEVLRAFDPETRKAFRTWMQDSSAGIQGYGYDLSQALAFLPQTFERFDELFRTLDTQEHAVRQLFRNGALTFDALNRRSGDLSGLIRSGEQVVRTTAARDQEIVDAFRAFPTFLAESRATLSRLREFSVNADPLMQQLTPAARELSPTLIEFGRLAPSMERFFDGFDVVIDNARRAFPAFQKLFRDEFPPLLQDLDPFLDQLNPLLSVIRAYRGDVTALVANAAAATNAETTVGLAGRPPKHLRTQPFMAPHSFFSAQNRYSSNRTNAYPRPGFMKDLLAGLDSFETRHCGVSDSVLDLTAPLDAAFNGRVGGVVSEAEDLFDRIQRFAFGNGTSTAGVPAPDCNQQAPFGPFGNSGAATQFPHTLRAP